MITILTHSSISFRYVQFTVYQSYTNKGIKSMCGSPAMWQELYNELNKDIMIKRYTSCAEGTYNREILLKAGI